VKRKQRNSNHASSQPKESPLADDHSSSRSAEDSNDETLDSQAIVYHSSSDDESRVFDDSAELFDESDNVSDSSDSANVEAGMSSFDSEESEFDTAIGPSKASASTKHAELDGNMSKAKLKFRKISLGAKQAM